MKAVILNQHGDASKLEYTTEFPTPQISENDVLVRIMSTSVNRADLVIRQGYPGLSIPLPHILGGDIVGEVAEIGSAVKDFQIGTRVLALPLITYDRSPTGISRYNLPEHQHLSLTWEYFGMHIHGSYAEYVKVPAENLVVLPDSISFDDAVSYGVAGLTAYHAISGVGKLQKDESFFIWGGSGGLGTLAIQIAKAMGCKVFTTCGQDSKKAKLLELGADYVFNHHTDDIPALLKEITPFGVDAVLDYVGPATFAQSFNMVKKGGRIMLCGILTGRETNISLHLTYLKHISIHGIYLGTKQELKELVDLAGQGKFNSNISEVLPLAQATEAHRLLESGKLIGKIVLKP